MGEDWGRNAAILQAIIDGTEYTDPPQSRIEALLLELKAVIEAGGGGGGTTNYNGLTNKPQINSVTLQGNLSTADLGIEIPTVDDAISGTSENPVQNKIIKGALDGKEDTLTFDNAPTAGSNNPVKSDGIKTALDAKQDTLTFDNAPTAGSNNPVKSDGIKTALDAKQDTLTFDNAPTAGSNNPVKSDGIKTALDAKQDTLTFDNAPTAGSNNPVKSDGIKTALDAKQDTLTFDDFPTKNSNNPVKSGGLYTIIANLLNGTIEFVVGEDVNNITSLLFIAQNCTNSPFETAYGITLDYDTNARIQIVADITTGEIKTRTKNSNGWTVWRGANSIIYG